jgi:AbrB family looped-hinge helix DNA binding protein
VCLELLAPGWKSILVAFAAVSRLAGVASIRQRDGMPVISIRPIAGLQYFCNAAFMQTAITITRRGVITLPARLRRALGLRAEDQLIAEVTPEGLLLRPAVTLPVEVYSTARVREFDEAEQELAESLRAQPAPGRVKPARKRAARRGR